MFKKIKSVYIFLTLTVLSVVLHNAVFAVLGLEEAFFFILTLVFFGLFVASIVLITLNYIKFKKPKDIYKLGWLGLFGLLGILPGFNYGLFGFFGFFGYFGLKSGKCGTIRYK